MNQYLKEVEPYLDGSNFELREKFVKKYSWAVPSNDALNIISKFNGGVVEIGAGTGYWASLLQNMGVPMIPFDEYIGGDNSYGHLRHWTHIYHGGNEVLSKFAPSVNLFLCWPPYDEPMAYDCLKAFKGNRLMYVGEGYYGCTGDDTFHEELSEKWNEVVCQEIPRWNGLRDALFIYERR